MIANSAARLVPLTPMSDQPPRAEPYVRYHGQNLFRRKGFLRGKLIHCPGTHVVNSDAVILGDGAIFCDNRPAKGQAPCGALIYLLTIPARGDAPHGIWLADCTREELREIQRRGLDPAGIIDYFGGSFGR